MGNFAKLIRGIIVDNFAGGGGASQGLENAFGRSVDEAINHDEDAIAMHKANHPTTRHHCESVWDVDPYEVCQGRPVSAAWFSPDCKHFSKSRGKKPVDKNIRGLAWVAKKWGGTVSPEVFFLENVEEFMTWGPLIAKRDKKTGRVVKKDDTVAKPGEYVPYANQQLVPDPKRSGKTFRKFIKDLNALGYKIEYRTLCAADYGAATTRTRFFMVARCDGRKIVWPKPTHVPANQITVTNSNLEPYDVIANHIEWNVPGKSIFGRKKDLAVKSKKRIAVGFRRFVLESDDAFIMEICNTGWNGVDRAQRSIYEPINTIVSKNQHCLVAPYTSRYFGKSIGQPVDKPIGAICAKPKDYLVLPLLRNCGGVNEPLGSVRQSAHIMKMKGTNLGSRVNEPLQTICAGGQHFATVTATMVKYYGSNIGHPVNEPIQTITSKDRFALAEFTTGDASDDDRYGAWWVARFLEEHGDLDTTGDALMELLPGTTSRANYIALDGHLISDIHMRMLMPRELYSASSFPTDYVIDRDDKGNPYPKYKQIERVGNAVPPVLAQVLARANCPYLIEEAAVAA